MSYVIQAVLSNPRRPECDQITIPFPIPFDQYDKTKRTFVKGDFTIKMRSPLTGIYKCYNSSEKKSLSTLFTS